VRVVVAYLPEIRAFVRAVLHDDDVDIVSDTRFDDLAGWDSMDLISVVVEVECSFSLTFEAEDIELLTTVGDLSEMIAAKRALAAA
jgi:acyl carrier protein